MTHLAVEGKVAAATQNQAFVALLFLYREFLGISLAGLETVVRAKKPQRLPEVLSGRCVESVFSASPHI